MRRTAHRFAITALTVAVAYAALIAMSGGGTRASAALLQTPVLRADPSMELRAAVLQGEHETLRRLARGHDDAPSLLARAYLAELDGDLAEARRFVGAAAGQASGGQTRRAVALAEARLARAAGDWDAAETRLREALSEHSTAYHLRVELGELLIDRGRDAEAEPILDQLSKEFNAGRLDSAPGLYALGRAMALLGSYKDANHAFELAYEKDSQFTPGIVEWGELLVSKYNTADAERTFQDALAVDDGHPEALAGMARVVMETQNYYAEAREHLRRAKKRHPSSPRVLLTRAELAIHDGKWDLALDFTEKILEERPKHLEALAVQAAVHYLKDDREAFERIKQQALELNPSYAEIYTRTAEFAVLVHRYREGVELHRKARKLDAGNSKALMGLGIGLSRLGRIDRAAEVLKKAFDADPYNVRVYNMLQFFDETLPEYDVFRHDRFVVRAHESQSKLVDDLVSPLISEAIETYTEKYSFEPAEELSIEIYRKPESFGVRTVGLPQISPHGICFGRVVATRSPREGNFNWRQVVWHEMAHVYHIQESGYRVPRWFTEGLAEYETNVKEPSWVRHHERQIAAALRDDDIPSITELDRRFSQARSYRDILRAYHLSSLVIHFIVDEWGGETVDEMVDAFGENIRTRKVIEQTIGVSVQKFDAEFRAWLQERLSGFERQLLISLKGLDPPQKLKETTPESRRDGWYHARLAVGEMRRGNSTKAAEAMKRALEIGSRDVRVQYAATAFYATRGRAGKAYEHGLNVLDEGRDDYLHRVRLGRLARVREDLEAARIHLMAAVQLYPDGSGAWRELLKVAESTDDRALERRAIVRMFELDQTNGDAARRYTEFFANAGQWRRAKEGVQRWYAIAPFDTEMQRARAKVARKVGAPEMAMEAWRALAELKSDNRQDIWLDALKSLSQTEGASAQVERATERARDAGASDAAIDEATVN